MPTPIFSRDLIAAVLTLAVACVRPAGAAPSTPPSNAVTNLADFDFMVEKIRLDYAGWDTKVTDANRAALTALTAKLRAKAAAADENQLADLLDQWIGFFHDGHTTVAHLSAGASGPGTSAAPQRVSGPNWTEAGVNRRLTAFGSGRDSIEGRRTCP